jgi:hypothetical protein
VFLTTVYLCQADEIAKGGNKEVVRWIQEASNKVQAQKDRERKMYKEFTLAHSSPITKNFSYLRFFFNLKRTVNFKRD